MLWAQAFLADDYCGATALLRQQNFYLIKKLFIAYMSHLLFWVETYYKYSRNRQLVNS